MYSAVYTISLYFKDMAGTCGVCNKGVRNNQKHVSCDWCQNCFHGACLKVSTETLNVYLNADLKIPWTCDNCRAKLQNLEKDNQRILKENNDLKMNNAALLERVCGIENELKKMKQAIKAEIISELRSELTTDPTSAVPPSQATLSEQISEVLREERDKERRKANLCVFGLPRQRSIPMM